ncbi:hypothetical protein MRX96_019467 [Rhipicephalus microplus]
MAPGWRKAGDPPVKLHLDTQTPPPRSSDVLLKEMRRKTTDSPLLLVTLLYLGPEWPFLVSPSALSPPSGGREEEVGPAACVDATRFPFIGPLSDAGACVEWAANLVQGEGGGPPDNAAPLSPFDPRRTLRRPAACRPALLPHWRERSCSLAHQHAPLRPERCALQATWTLASKAAPFRWLTALTGRVPPVISP